MNNLGSEESGNAQPVSVGAIRVLEEMMETSSEELNQNMMKIVNKNYESNAKESFLQYANLLETITEDATKRKRKRGTRKKIMPSIRIVLNYKGKNVL